MGADRKASGGLGELLGASSLLASRDVLNRLLGLLRTKIVAVVVGAGGLGILSQANQFLSFGAMVVNFGLGGGVAKYTADHLSTGRVDRLRALVGTLSSVFLVAGLTAVAGTALAARPIADLIFADPELWGFTLAAAIAIPVLAQFRLATFILQGALEFKAIAVSNVLGTTVSTAITVGMVLTFGLSGAIWSIPLSAGVMLWATQRALKKRVLGPRGIHARPGKPDPNVVKDLSGYGAAGVVNQLATSLTELTARTVMIQRLGEVANGLYQVAYGFSSQLFGLVSTALYSYLMPRIAGLRDDTAAINRVRNDALKVYLAIGLPLGIASLAAAPLWIPLLYSREFLAAEVVVRYHLAGEMVRGIRLLLSAGLLARKKLRPVVGLSIAKAVIFLLAFFLLLPHLGVAAPSGAYLATHGVMLLPDIFILRRIDDLRLDPMVVAGLVYFLVTTLLWQLGYGLWGRTGANVVGGVAVAIWLVALTKAGVWARVKEVLATRGRSAKRQD